MIRPKFVCNGCVKLFHADKLIKTYIEGKQKTLCRKCLIESEPIPEVSIKEYSINTACVFLGCSYPYLRKLIAEGKIPYKWKLTRHKVIIKETDLLELKKKLEFDKLNNSNNGLDVSNKDENGHSLI